MDIAKPANATEVLRGDRKKGLVVPEKQSLLLVGSTVVVCPDMDGQATDRLSKYNLGLNIGRIETINHDENMVELWWYWGSGWSDSWLLWRAPKTKAAYREWVHVSDLACDELNHIVRIKMESISGREKFKMAKESVKEIMRCLEAHKSMLYCMTDKSAGGTDFDESDSSD